MNRDVQQQYVRQITPEEAQRAQMSSKKLQETQVLNLKDVQEIARIERRTSKKPAIVVAIIGVFFLAIGGSFKVYEIMKSREPKIEKRAIQEKKQDDNLIGEELKCSSILLNNPDGTDTGYDISYNFKEKSLVGFTKVFSINAIANNPISSQTMHNYSVAYQSFLNQLDGYSITVVPNQDLTQIIVTVKVDLTRLDLTKLPEIQQTHFSTKVDYVSGTQKSVIQNDMITQGFTCQ